MSTVSRIQTAITLYADLVKGRAYILDNAPRDSVTVALEHAYSEFTKECKSNCVTALDLAIAVDEYQRTIHGGDYTWLDVLAARNLAHVHEKLKFDTVFQDHPLELAAYDLVRVYYAGVKCCG